MINEQILTFLMLSNEISENFPKIIGFISLSIGFLILLSLQKKQIFPL